jgi:hypothetical protein
MRCEVSGVRHHSGEVGIVISWRQTFCLRLPFPEPAPGQGLVETELRSQRSRTRRSRARRAPGSEARRLCIGKERSNPSPTPQGCGYDGPDDQLTFDRGSSQDHRFVTPVGKTFTHTVACAAYRLIEQSRTWTKLRRITCPAHSRGSVTAYGTSDKGSGALQGWPATVAHGGGGASFRVADCTISMIQSSLLPRQSSLAGYASGAGLRT